MLVYINRITHLATRRSKFQLLPLLPCTPKRSIFNNTQASSDPAPPFTALTAHRLILAGLVVAAKYTSDGHVTAIRAAKVGGVSARELQELELEFFIKLSFDCVVQNAELECICRAVWGNTTAGKSELGSIAIASRRIESETTASDITRGSS